MAFEMPATLHTSPSTVPGGGQCDGTCTAFSRFTCSVVKYVKLSVADSSTSGIANNDDDEGEKS